MDNHDAAATLDYAGQLWRFVAKWSEAEQDTFTDGLVRIPIDFQQAKAAMAELKRRTEKTPPQSLLLRTLWALVPDQRQTISPPEPQRDRGPLMTLQEFVAGVAAGVYAPCDETVPAGIRHHLDLSNPKSALSVLVAKHRAGGVCHLRDIFDPPKDNPAREAKRAETLAMAAGSAEAAHEAEITARIASALNPQTYRDDRALDAPLFNGRVA